MTDDLEKQLAELEAELKDRKDALPAHSIRPAQLMEVEELEERVKQLRKQLGEKKDS